MAFIDIIDLAAYIKSDVEDMGWLGEFAVRVAEEAVLGILGRDIAYVEDDEITLDGSGTDALLLPNFPVSDVFLVTVGGTELVADTDYTLGPAGILYRLGATWALGRANVAITYTHGWGEIGSDSGNEVPMTIREAALSYARGIFEAGSTPSSGIAGETLGAYSYTVSSASLAAAAATERLGDLRAKLAPFLDVRI